MVRTLFVGLCLLIFSGIAGAQTAPATLYQRPAVNDSTIAFAYAGDLWTVSRSGGMAERLTSGVGNETGPIFSPDGKWIAFTGEYDGNTDVFIVPATGGVPKRLTAHPSPDTAVGWTPDGGRVLFSSTRKSTSNYPRLFTVPVSGEGLPDELPLPMAERGSYSADGQFIAYEPLSQWQPEWKRHRGGQQDYIWIAKLADSTVTPIPRDNATDRYPMWVGNRIFFVSDRGSEEGTMSLFSFDVKSKEVKQVLKNEGLDIKYASAWKNTIVYEQFGAIFLFNPDNNQAKKVDIRVAGDFPGVRPRFERVGGQIANYAVSPNGIRAVVEARGEIVTVPADKGDPRNLTQTPGVMERNPQWSPDGQSIAYFSDESGEYALHVRNQKGDGEVKKFNLGAPTFYFNPVWSPDSKKIAYMDKRMDLWYVELATGKTVKIDHNPLGLPDDVFEASWSPDSKWVTYAKHLPNLLRAVFIYSVEGGTTKQVTDGLSDARYPVFDKGGKYIYFTASTDVGPKVSFADLSGIDHRVTRAVYAIVLAADSASPLAPESDEEKIEGDKKPGEGDKPAGGPGGPGGPGGMPGKGPAKPAETKVDFDDIDQRVVALPIPVRNFVDLQAGKANTLFILEAPDDGDGGPFAGLTVHKYDLEKRKLDKAFEGVSGFRVTANGDKAMVGQRGQWLIQSLILPNKPGEGVLKTSEIEVRVDPKAEWRQMYHEAWRDERDFFYDKGVHGLDIPAAEKTYAPYLEAVAHRADLNYLFTEMLNQLTVGHTFIGGGDIPRPGFVPGGLLGADYKIENGRYRFAKIYRGENWNPQLRSPLTQPGARVKEGEYLFAVNGMDVKAIDDVDRFFIAKAGKQVVIKVGPNADGSGTREVTVVPIPSESALRNREWVENNRKKVAELSGGRLAYIYMPNTGGDGYSSFVRYFFAQTDKQGAILDERFNGGGLLSDYVVETLTRKHLANIHYREGGQDVPVPAGAIYGPKVLLINELAGSGGDALPWFFRKAGVGQMVGKKTWGGLVAAFRPPPLMDGGSITAPDAAIYGLDGQWEVENVGVAPDVEVEMDPAAWRAGRDPQLEKGVEIALKQLEANPRKPSPLPPFPKYKRNGISGQK